MARIPLFSLEGEVRALWVDVIHTDVAPRANFSCSDVLLNRLFDSCRRSLLGNMHGGVISDCPHRERLGYTGDAQNTADIAMLLFDADALYRKYIRDIADTQDKNTGHIQHTAPFFGGGGGPGGWGCAIVTIPYMHYRHYGDAQLLRQYYPNMAAYIRYMESRCVNDLVMFEEKDGWCLGEWGVLGEVQIPPEFVNTYFLIRSLMRMQEIAAVLGEPTETLAALEQKHKAALVAHFYDQAENSFCHNQNGADAFAADIGLADARCIAALHEKYQHQKLDTGIFGTPLLLDLLFQNGYGDTAFKLLTEPGKHTLHEHHMVLGATTLWENWAGGSHNHHMFGALVSCFFTGILGIQASDAGVIAPQPPCALAAASGYVQTRAGMVFVSYERKDNKIHFTVYSENDAVFAYKQERHLVRGGTQCSFAFDEQPTR